MKQKKLELALICYDNPFLPPTEGGKKGMMSRINSLLLLNKYDIDLFLLNKQAEGFAKIPEQIRDKMRDIKQYRMRVGLHTIIEKYPICVNRRFVPECANDIKKKHYDIVIYEGAQVAAYRLEGIVNAKHHIIYLHDIESEYRAQIASSLKNPIMKLANIRESIRFRKIERQINDCFDQVWFVSKDECERFAKEYLEAEKGVYIPFPAIRFNESVVDTKNKHRMLYVGDMTVKHNVLSMIWFAQKVLPRIREYVPDVELVLIGRISDQNRAHLEALGTEVKGYVDDLEKEYQEASCVVCPVLFGAGVKVKTIDSISMGQIVITNHKGIEGTELENRKHVLIDDSEEDLARTCIGVLSNRKQYIHIAQAGLDYVKKNHSIENQAELIDSCIAKL